MNVVLVCHKNTIFFVLNIKTQHSLCQKPLSLKTLRQLSQYNTMQKVQGKTLLALMIDVSLQ